MKRHKQTLLTIQSTIWKIPIAANAQIQLFTTVAILQPGIPLQKPTASRGLDRGSKNDVIPVYHSAFDLTIVKL